MLTALVAMTFLTGAFFGSWVTVVSAIFMDPDTNPKNLKPAPKKDIDLPFNVQDLHVTK